MTKSYRGGSTIMCRAHRVYGDVFVLRVEQTEMGNRRKIEVGRHHPVQPCPLPPSSSEHLGATFRA